MVGESTGGHVWLERLTDDANVWLTAVRLEEQGELAKAAALYLDDAIRCLDECAIPRAALGVTCAADCFAKLGSPARSRRLYHVAGMAYWDNAEARMGSSVRESLWSLQEAYECFVLSGEDENASQVRSLFGALAGRANPFIGERDSFRLPQKERLSDGHSERGEAAVEYDEPLELVSKFEALLRARDKQREKSRSERPVLSPQDPEMETLDAQGFVGQLG